MPNPPPPPPPLESLQIAACLFLLVKKALLWYLPSLVSCFRDLSGPGDHTVHGFYLSHTRKFWEAFTDQPKEARQISSIHYIRYSSYLATMGVEYQLLPAVHFHGHTHNNNHSTLCTHIRDSRCACLRDVLDRWSASAVPRSLTKTLYLVPPARRPLVVRDRA